MPRTRMRRTVIVGATVGAVLLTGGVAFAFWSSTGTGSGAAAVGTAAGSLTVVQSGTAPSDLRPGGTPQDVTVTVTNSSGTAIGFTDVTVTIDDVVEDASVTGTCSPLDFAIVDNASYSGEVLDAGGDSTTFVAATLQLTETGVNQDACKGADVSLSLVAN